MIRKKIWMNGDSTPTLTAHIVNGSATVSSQVVDDYLEVSFTQNTTSYAYWDMSNISDYVIQSGDYIEYEVYWETSGAIQAAMDFTLSDGGQLRDSGTTDSNSYSMHPAADLSAVASGKWYKRKAKITDFTNGYAVGKTLQYFDIVCEFDQTTGSSIKVARYKNIAITDENGLVTDNYLKHYRRSRSLGLITNY